MMSQATKAATPAAGPRFTDPDFVVIGSGAAGGVIAKELSVTGFTVVVLEQGPYLRPKDFTHDEVKTLLETYLTNDWGPQPNTFRKTPSDRAVTQPAVIYGRQVGGSTVHFTANYWRFHPIDFHERSRKGAIAGTGFDDWPMTYDELEPYYVKVEHEVGVSGLPSANPFDPPRSKPLAMPPLPIKSSGALAETVAPAMPSANAIAACKWLPDNELRVYSSEYERSGFQGGLEEYRVRWIEKYHAELQLFSRRTIDVPSLFVAGKSDWGVYQNPGDFERMKTAVCTRMLGTNFVEGAGHWVQQERPEEVSKLLVQFLKQ